MYSIEIYTRGQRSLPVPNSNTILQLLSTLSAHVAYKYAFESFLASRNRLLFIKLLDKKPILMYSFVCLTHSKLKIYLFESVFFLSLGIKNKILPGEKDIPKIPEIEAVSFNKYR